MRAKIESAHAASNQNPHDFNAARTSNASERPNATAKHAIPDIARNAGGASMLQLASP